TGDVLHYQWDSNIVALNDGTTPWVSTRAGVTTPTLIMSNVQLEDAGRYICRVYNPCGTAFTQVVRLFIAEPCPVDFNMDGFVEPGDLDEFITAFFEGC
ncbi:MAG: immunoglobulin domain-containing protein, partial [Phycisphaerales bacterium]